MQAMTKYSAKELKGMSLAVLSEVGEDLGLTFGKNHSKAERAKRILAAYADLSLSAGSVPDSPPSHADPHTPQGSPKPDFERLIDGPPDEHDADATPSGSRGGARPGAGRPEGMTAEIAAYNQLSKQPHPAIRMGIERAFELWADRVKCPEVKLSKEEAVALALPWTQAYELSPLHGRLPPSLMVVLSCVWSTAMIVSGKARMAREAAAHRREVESMPVEMRN
jgi:hypothetical protein